MAPPVDDPLQGLNSVPQPPPPSALSDSQDLLSVPPYSDLAAQLDLWTHISFASDEPFVAHDADAGDKNPDKEQAFDRESGGASEEIKRKRQLLGGRRLPADHPRSDPFPQPAPQPQPLINTQTPVPQPFDLQNLFALAAMSVPQVAPDLQNMNIQNMSLQNLLALSAYNPFLQQSAAAAALPTFTGQPAISTPVSSTPVPASPSTKKTRARKASTGPPSSLFIPSTEAPADPKHVDPSSPIEDDPSESAPSLSPSEDKRRRNTQASARFRLKKKEREAAMETRCRELEAKVSELERECEALRRENGWLKGLVVGVTGGTQMPVMPGPGVGLPSLSSAPSTAPPAKRPRDEAER